MKNYYFLLDFNRRAIGNATSKQWHTSNTKKKSRLEKFLSIDFIRLFGTWKKSESLNRMRSFANKPCHFRMSHFLDTLHRRYCRKGEMNKISG